MIENDVYVGFPTKVQHQRSMYNLVTGDMKLLLVYKIGIGIQEYIASRKFQRLSVKHNLCNEENFKFSFVLTLILIQDIHIIF